MRSFLFTKFLVILLILPNALESADFNLALPLKTGKYYHMTINAPSRGSQPGEEAKKSLLLRVFISKSTKYFIRIKLPLKNSLYPTGIFDYKKTKILISSSYYLKSLASVPAQFNAGFKYDNPFLYMGNVIYTITTSKLKTGLYFFNISAATDGKHLPLPISILIDKSKTEVSAVISLFAEYVAILKSANKLLSRINPGDTLSSSRLWEVKAVIRKIRLLKAKIAGLSDPEKQYFKKRLLLHREPKIFAGHIQRLGINRTY